MASQSLSFAFYGVDATVSSTLRKIQNEFSNTDAKVTSSSRTMDDASKSADGLGKSLESSSKTMGDASKSADSLSKSSDTLDKSLKSSAKSEDEFGKSSDNLDKSLKSSSKAEDDLSKSSDNLDKSLASSSKAEDDLSKSSDNLDKSLASSSKAEDDLRKSSDNLGKSLGSSSKADDDLSKSSDNLGKSLKSSSQTMDESSKSSDNFSRSVDQAVTGALQKMQGMLGESDNKVRSFSKSTDESSKSFDGFGKAITTAINPTKLFAGTFDLIKFPAMVAGANEAVGAISALGAGALMAATQFAPLAGLLPAYGVGMLAYAQATGVAKLAMGGLGPAFKAAETGGAAYTKALAKLSPAQQEFVKQVAPMAKELQKLKDVAATNMLPGLTEGIKAASPLIGAFKPVIADTAKALGGLAVEAGKLLGSGPFRKDFATITSGNITIIKNLGSAGITLVGALAKVLAAASPLTVALSNMAGKGAGAISKWVDEASKSGALTRFFDKTLEVVKSLISTLGNFGAAFGPIFSAASKSGAGFLDLLNRGAKAFNEWTHSASGKNTIAKVFSDAQIVLHSLGGLLASVITNFNGFGSGAGGKALASLIDKISKDAVPAFAALAKNVSQQFVNSLATLATNLLKIFSVIGGNSGTLTGFVGAMAALSGAIAKVMQVCPPLGTAISALLTIVAVGKLTGITSLALGLGKIALGMGQVKSIGSLKAVFLGNAEGITAEALATERLNLANKAGVGSTVAGAAGKGTVVAAGKGAVGVGALTAVSTAATAAALAAGSIYATKMLEGFGQKLKDSTSSLGKTVGNFFTMVGGISPFSLKHLGGINAESIVSGFVGALTNLGPTVVHASSSLFESIVSPGAKEKAKAQAAQAASEWGSALAVGLGKKKPDVQKGAFSLVTAAQGAFSALGPDAKQFGYNAGNTFANSIKERGPLAKSAAVGLANSAGSGLNGIIQAASKSGMEAGIAFQNSIGKQAPGAAKAGSAIQGAADGMLNHFRTNASAHGTAGGVNFAKAMGIQAPVVQKAAGTLVTNAGTPFSRLAGVGTTAGGQAGQGLASGLAKTKSNVFSGADALKGQVANAFKPLSALGAVQGQNTGNSFGSGLTDGIKKQKNPVADAGKNIGKAILDGFRNGTVGQIVGFAKDLVTGIINNVKSFFGIHSASTVFTQIGKDVALGLFNGIRAGIAAIPALFSGLWNGVRTVTTTAWNVIKTAVTAGVNLLKSVITAGMSAVTAVWKTAWDVVKTAATTAWTLIKTAVSTGVNLLKSVITAGMSAVTTVWKTAWGVISAFATTTWNAIKSLVTTGVNAVKTVITTVMGAIKSFWTTTWTAIQTFATTTWNAIKTLVTAAINAVKTTITTVMNAIKSFWTTTWTAIQTFATSTWNAIKTLVTTGINAVKTVITTTMNAIKSFWTTTWTAIQTFATTTWNAIKSLITAAINAVKTTITTVMNTIKSTWTTVWTAIHTFATTTWNAIKSLITAAINAVKTTITTVMNTIKTTWTTVWTAIRTFATTTWNAIKTLITAAINAVKSTMTSVTGAISTNWSKFMNGIHNVASTVWTSIKSVFTGAMNSIHSGVDSLVTFVTKRWDALKNALKAPVSFILHPVLSTMAAGINTIGKLVGLPSIPAIPTLATGGQIPGHSPHKRADNIPIMATAGEHMWTVDEVKGAGGHPAVEKMRAAALTGRKPAPSEAVRISAGEFDPLAAGNPFGYATGGAISGWPKVSAWIMSHLGIPYSYGGGNDSRPTLGIAQGAHTVGYDCSSFTKAALNAGGIHVQRTAAGQQGQVARIARPSSPDKLLMGDLGFIGNPAHHVEMYVGGGNWAEEQQTGTSSHIRGQGLGGFTNFGQPGTGGGSIGQALSAAGGIISTVWKKFREALAGLFNVTVRKPTEALISKIPGISGMGNWLPKTAAFPLDKAYEWLKGGADKKAAAEAAGNIAGGSTSAGANISGSAQTIAKALLAQRSWQAQWPAFNSLVMAESGWRVNATNPSSGAYGIPQALPGSKMASAGADWKTNANTQLRWMMGYIASTYGNPNKAWAHEQSNHWYGKGGEIKGYATGTPYVPQTGLAMLHTGEAVIPAAQNRKGGGSSTTIHLTVNVTQPLGTADQIGGVIRDALEKTHRKGARSVVLGF